MNDMFPNEGWKSAPKRAVVKRVKVFAVAGAQPQFEFKPRKRKR